MANETDELQSLRRGLRDLVALTTLPAIWSGNKPEEIAESLSDVLQTLLRLDLVYVCLRWQLEDTPLELVRSNHELIRGREAQQIGEQFAPYLTTDASNPILSIPDPFRGDTLQMLVIPVGHHGSGGHIVVGTRSSHPFTELDRLLLNVAANQAKTAIDQARLHEVEKHARLLAEEANATKLRFLAMISHELRTPLTSIKGFASTLLAEDVTFQPDERQSYIRIIEEESDKLSELVEQLLDLARLQSGTMRISPEITLLDRLFDTATPQLKLLTPNHTLRIVPVSQTTLVMADQQRVIQVLSNLVHNAVKYSSPDTAITISAVQHDHEVQVDVQDQGIGISFEDRSKLFEAFKQLDRKVNTHKGAGLGLAICKGLIEAHGGKIWIQDQPPPGTTVSFTLPIAASATM